MNQFNRFQSSSSSSAPETSSPSGSPETNGNPSNLGAGSAPTALHLAVVGAGQIGTPLVERLRALGHQVTWVSRSRPKQVPEGVTHHALDASDGEALAKVVRGAQALIAAVNPAQYDAAVWAKTLPPLHRGLIEGAGKAEVRLVLLDALYLYTTDEGPLSPQTRQEPKTEKGKVRKQLSDLLATAQRSHQVRATVLRAPDFWGNGLSSALFTEQTLASLRRGKRPLLLGDPSQPHAFAHRDDVIESLIALALAPSDVEGQVFHAPVIHVPPQALAAAYAKAFGVTVRPFVLPRWLLRMMSPFFTPIRGLLEMLPQWEQPYLVDDSSFCVRFGVKATTLEEGMANVAEPTRHDVPTAPLAQA
jgi:nucleoside-diphosphate-sugar epimerase